MLVLPPLGEQKKFVPFGQRRGVSDLARFAGNPTWASAETECSPGTRAYPSPPMSGSPRLPPKPTQEAGDRGERSFQAAARDVHHPESTFSGGDPRLPPRIAPQQPPPPPPILGETRPISLEGSERIGYPYSRPEDIMGRPLSFAPQLQPPQPGQLASHPQFSSMPPAGPMPTASSFPLQTRPQTSEGSQYTSPKSQRKTKGHVASACVPCKRAHLRCDAQRPCSRCMSNGKEDACVDVQHKKRGRPRLREEREPRYDPSRFQPASDAGRRMSLHATPSAAVVPMDDPIRRTNSQSYRVIKSNFTEPPPPRYPERGSASDANIYPPPLVIPHRPVEPVAFLSTDFTIVRVSSTFVEAIGAGAAQAIRGRKLVEIISTGPGERERVMRLENAIQQEHGGRKSQNLLPPIVPPGELERVIHALPLDVDFIWKLPLDRQDRLTLMSPDTTPRPFAVRVGLVKEDSVYFVVVHLLPPGPFPHLTPSPQTREPSYTQQTPYPVQLTPMSASFDSNWSRYGGPRDPREGAMMQRLPLTPGQMGSTASPGVNPNVPSYTPSSSGRADHPAGAAYQIPRSELPATRPPPEASYQLPPIRHQSQTGAPPPTDPRTGRVDIGGLIDRPGHARRGP